MNSTRSAVICLPSFPEGHEYLLNRDIAGIGLLKRLVLTLQRAGLDHVLVLMDPNIQKRRASLEPDIVDDPRFKSRLYFASMDSLKNEKDWDRARQPLTGNQILIVRSNLVTTPKLIRSFLDEAARSAPTDKESFSFQGSGEMYLIPSETLSTLQSGTRSAFQIKTARTLQSQISNPFLKEIKDPASARLAEAGLIKSYRSSYTQFMDIWFNSLLSAPISSFLVKLPITPNQVTLFGLVIGLAAAWFFSWGNHTGEFLGAILLAGTAVWDCCDGEVARLKFMESDFGETLDTACDNIINVFIFTGMMIGVSHQRGTLYAMIPFFLLVLGGGLIFYLIYFPSRGKGSLFRGTWAYQAIQTLASRNFIYVILVFALFGRLDAFLWSAGIGSNLFGLALLYTRQRILTDGGSFSKD